MRPSEKIKRINKDMQLILYSPGIWVYIVMDDMSQIFACLYANVCDIPSFTMYNPDTWRILTLRE